ncbi:hypothetical protein V7147_17210 [Bacillus sp. JJ1521]|uniref:hypothetical protein n=1 Tax=Bacillus sp. JJ1521 TaxID=3122957 RepID=UPI002FFDB5C3
MKRYWKIITLSIVTVIVLGSYLIQSSLAAENIQVEFEKVSGDESLVENIVLNAQYEVGDIYQSFLISKGETTNLSNRSVFQQLSGHGFDSYSNQLIENYKQFMRGKYLFPSSFYDDESLLIYANIEGRSINASTVNSYFDIDVLDKKSKESTSMKIDLPKNSDYSWVDMVDIQILDGKLKLITRASRINGGEDFTVYTIDLKGKKVTNEEVIYSSPIVENGWSGFRVFNDYYSSQPQNYLLFKVEAEEYNDDNGESTNIANELMVYDIENNKAVKMELPEDFAGVLDNSIVSNSILYIPVLSVNGVEVIQYDIEAEKWDKKQTFKVGQSGDSENSYFVKLKDEKIYIISSTNDGYILSIGDINTGESLYEGKLIIKSQKSDQKEYRIYFSDIK